MLESEPGRRGNISHATHLQAAAAAPSTAAHWSSLANAENEIGFSTAWLELQCTRIAGVSAGLLALQREKGASSTVVTWPAGRDPGGSEALSKLAEQAIRERRTIGVVEVVTSAGPHRQPPNQLLAVPLGAGGQVIAAVAVRLIGERTPDNIAKHVEQLSWGAGWLEALPRARALKASSAHNARALSCLDIVAIVGEQPRLLGMAIALANELASRLRCDRVSVGLQRRAGQGVRLAAISHSATFKSRSRLTDAIESAMEEAIDQSASVAYPPLPAMARTITMAHRALAETAKVPGAATLSVVLADGNGAPIGAIALERTAGAFDEDTLKLAELIARLVGPMIGLHRRADALVGGRLSDGFGRGVKALVGPRRPTLKLGAMAAAALIAALCLATTEFRVAARAVLEPEVQRAAVAPIDGFIHAAVVRAGDTVRSGDLLASLDDRDLLLELSKERAARDKLLQKQREALAKHDRSNLVILESQIRQANSQVSLIEGKLERVRILAPFDGLVVSGDLSQMLGSPVEKGKALFEIAPLNAYRLIVHVDERDIRFIAAGQKGTVTLTGSPWTPLPLVLSKITPVTVAAEGRNTFRVEAQVTGQHLRPGMEGIAKIETGKQQALWVWVRPVVEWLRLAVWKYLP